MEQRPLDQSIAATYNYKPITFSWIYYKLKGLFWPPVIIRPYLLRRLSSWKWASPSSGWLWARDVRWRMWPRNHRSNRPRNARRFWWNDCWRVARDCCSGIEKNSSYVWDQIWLRLWPGRSHNCYFMTQNWVDHRMPMPNFSLDT